MTAIECAIDGRPTEDGWICVGCADRAGRHLAEIVRLVPDARLVAAGLVRTGSDGPGLPAASRPPLNVDALDALDAVTNALATLARGIAETRGLQIDSAALGDLSPADPLTLAAKWISGQMEWLRHAVTDQGDPYAVDVFGEISDCAARMRRLVEGPHPQRYLGPCGAILECNPIRHANDCPEGCGITEPVCDGDVYGPDGGSTGRCRTCGATVDQTARREWLTDQVRDSGLAWSARGIADAYGIPAKTIRSWATQIVAPNGKTIRAAKLSTYWRDPAGRLVPWVEPAAHLTPAQRQAELRARGERLHYVADVTALDREATQRRARREARTETEGAA